MVITTEHVEVETSGGPMRMLLAAPKAAGTYPAVLFYSDIFQLTGPMERSCARLAGYGYVVAAPEIYHRLEPPGTVIAFDDEGRERGLRDALMTRVAEFDEDCRAALDYLAAHERTAEGKLAVAGFCLGGHLAFRAALNADVLATVCFYGTGIHTGKLGMDEDAGSLSRAAEIEGELLMVFGTADPHIPEDGRARIKAALEAAGVKHDFKLYQAEHAFMRDEGPRYDPEATDSAFADMLNLFKRTLA